MMKALDIQQIAQLPPQILILEKEAIAEGFRFVTRLISEWHSGENRFDAPGECLMAVHSNQQLIAIGGLSIDPYAGKQTARLRRVYVAASSRGQHVGKALIKALIDHAALRFHTVRLSTDTPEGNAFYLHCGFERSDDGRATHVMRLGVG